MKIERNELLKQMKIVFADEFVANVEVVGEEIVLSFNDEQKFSVTVKEL